MHGISCIKCSITLMIWIDPYRVSRPWIAIRIVSPPPSQYSPLTLVLISLLINLAEIHIIYIRQIYMGFFFTKRIWSTCSGRRVLLAADTTSPAVEKSLSDATEVAEMQRLAKGANVGKKDARSFHNWSGSSFISSIWGPLWLLKSGSCHKVTGELVMVPGGSCINIAIFGAAAIRYIAKRRDTIYRGIDNIAHP